MKNKLISLLSIPLFLGLGSCTKNFIGKIIEEGTVNNLSDQNNYKAYVLKTEKGKITGTFIPEQIDLDPFNVGDKVEVKLSIIPQLKELAPRYIDGKLYQLKYHKIIEYSKDSKK